MSSSPPLISDISLSTFTTLLNQYPSIIPSKLATLDESRYTTVPSCRPTHLTQNQALTLLEWKLSHGTFRPKLKQLLLSNSSSDIESITREAIAAYKKDDGQGSIKNAINNLTKLKGIGPATASLYLSVAYPDQVPFFSDELFRWCFWEDGRGHGWDRPIKYSIKEYLELCDKVGELTERIGVKAVDVEKVAYVLGKTKQGVEGDGGKMEGKKRKADEAILVETKEENDGESGAAAASSLSKKKTTTKPSTSGRSDTETPASNSNTSKQVSQAKEPSKPTRTSTRARSNGASASS